LKTLFTIRDYRKDKKKLINKENTYNYQNHFTHLAQLSSLSHNVFESLQNERHYLIESLYQDSIDKLLESCLNNFKCSGIWYQDFLVASNLSDSPTQRLVAYLLLQEVIKFTFSKKTTSTTSQIHLRADENLIPEKIIVLEESKISL